MLSLDGYTHATAEHKRVESPGEGGDGVVDFDEGTVLQTHEPDVVDSLRAELPEEAPGDHPLELHEVFVCLVQLLAGSSGDSCI